MTQEAKCKCSLLHTPVPEPILQLGLLQVEEPMVVLQAQGLLVGTNQAILMKAELVAAILLKEAETIGRQTALRPTTTCTNKAILPTEAKTKLITVTTGTPNTVAALLSKISTTPLRVVAGEKETIVTEK